MVKLHFVCQSKRFSSLPPDQKVVKLATFAEILLAKMFFYSPWQSKRSQLGALKKSRKQAKEAHTVRAYPGFCSMKQLRVLLFPPGWDASLLQGYLPPAVCCQYPFYTPGWRETMWGKVSCLRKQHDGRD